MLNFHSIEINYLGVGLPVSSVLFDADQVSAIMLFILKKKIWAVRFISEIPANPKEFFMKSGEKKLQLLKWSGVLSSLKFWFCDDAEGCGVDNL